MNMRNIKNEINLDQISFSNPVSAQADFSQSLELERDDDQRYSGDLQLVMPSAFNKDDEAVEFLDDRFAEDKDLRLSGEQRLKLDIMRDLRKPCNKKEYSQKLKEAAHKLGKSTRTIRRLVKAWEEDGLASLLEPTHRKDKGKPRKSDFWYNFVTKDYKAGNKGARNKTRAQVVESVNVKAYALAKAEIKSEIIALEQKGWRGEDLDFEIEKLIRRRGQGAGFEYWLTKGKPPSRRTVERWLKPLEDEQDQATSSRSAGWHGSKLVLKTRAGRELEVRHSNQVWQIDHTKADVLLVDEDGVEIGRPILTTVIDCYSRCIMGFRLGFAGPKSNYTALALRHAILPKRYSSHYQLRSKWDCYGVPKYLFTDGGSDFCSSHMIEWVADQLNFEPELRRYPSEGGIVERPFRTLSELMRQIGGYTGSNVLERPDDASSRACLTLADLEWLLVGYFADNYNQQPCPATRSNPYAPVQSRVERWHAGLHIAPVLYNERQLDVCLMKATERVVKDYGHLTFANLRYKAENLAAYSGQTVFVRFDPRDITMIFVYSRQDNREKFLARAYAIGLEAEHFSFEEIMHAAKKAKMKGKGINNIAILEEATRRQEFLKRKAKKTKAERRKAEQKKYDQVSSRVEQEDNTPIEENFALTDMEYELTEKVDYDLMKEELGL